MVHTKRMPTGAILWQPSGCPAESKAEGISERLLVQVVAISQHWGCGTLFAGLLHCHLFDFGSLGFRDQPPWWC